MTKLTKEQRKEMAYKEYEKIKNPALEEYEKINNQAWEEYLKIETPAYKEYLKKIKEIEDEPEETLDTGSRTFKFPKGYMWDGDEQIIEWIMDKLKVCDENNWTVEEDTFFVVHSSRREE